MMTRNILAVFALLASPLCFAEALHRSVEGLSEAIRYETISHQNEEEMRYEAFDAFLALLKKRYPLSFERLAVDTINNYSLLLTWQGSDAALKPVMFDGHYDVVPVEPGTEADWAYPPFSGVIADGYVWGRGAIDDKGGVISLLEGLEALLAEGYQPARTLIFSVVHDEEIGGEGGAVRVAEHLLEKGVQLEYMVGEGGMMASGSSLLPEGQLLALIGTAEKHYVTLILTAKGEGGHSSKPPSNSALVRLAKAVTVLHENAFEPELVAPATDMFEALAPYQGGMKGLMMAYSDLFGGLIASGLAEDEHLQGMVRTTTAVTMLNGGIKENVIPQSAQAAVNFRLLPNITPDELVEIVRRKIDDPEIEIAISDKIPLGETLPVADKNGPGFAMLADAILAVEPSAIVVPNLFLATTDTRHYGRLTDNIYRFRALAIDQEDAAVVHGTNERISTASMIRAFKITREMIRGAGSS